jgi:hypothetical protein
MANEKMERVDYIVLDGINSTWDSTTYKANWDIGDYMFKQYKDDDEVFISLHSCDFTASVEYPSSSVIEVYMSDVSIKNQENTNREDVLSIREGTILLRSAVYYMSPKNNNGTDMMLNVNKFYKIKLGVVYHGAYIDINEFQKFMFVLKVSYKKRN